MKLLDFALQMELDGKAYYERLKTETPVVGLQKIFAILAADEQKHYDILNEIRAGVDREMADSTALEQAKDIFKHLQIEEGELERLRSKLDVFQHAAQMEADGIRVYEDIAREESENGNPDVVELVLKIIREEKKHYNSLENICELISANERMVPWRDFSAIKEYKTID